MHEVRKLAPQCPEIPLEILWEIFEIYAESDGRENPLEKLLSICQTWRVAAYQHQALWSSFGVTIKVDDDIRFWRSRIPSRLNLCGDSLLDVAVTVRPNIIWSSDTVDMMKEIVPLLIGREGILIERWRRLCVNMPPAFQHRVWSKALSSPTPNLFFLRIIGLHFKGPILPFAPSLKELQVIQYPFKLLSSLKELKVLELDVPHIQNDDIELAFSSSKLVHLELVRCAEVLRFPSTFPNLQSVYLMDQLDLNFTESFSAPGLRSIRIWSRKKGTISAIQNCRGIDIRQLETVGFSFDRMPAAFGWRAPPLYTESGLMDIMEEMKQFVQELSAVTTFEALDWTAFRVLILCFQERIHPPTRERGCTLEMTRGNLIHRTPKQRFIIPPILTAIDLQHIRQSAFWPLNDSWKAICADLYRYGY
jgi:hypothetical protein